MEQITYILFGWLLGLLSPVIIDKIKSEYTKKQFFKAICAELHDLQFRVVTVSLTLGQQYGTIDREFLQWIKPIIENYEGNEPNASILELVNSMLTVKESEFNAIVQCSRAAPYVGLGLKSFSASFIETNLTQVSNLPIELQVKLHEFRNHLSTLNQEINMANDIHKLTFDSSISGVNHEIISKELISKYAFIQGMCKRVADKLGAVVSSTM
jgi:hypothetical protein